MHPPNGIFAEEPKYPSHGGRPWPIEIRNMVISMHLNGVNFWDANLACMHANFKFPLMNTVKQWIFQYNFEGTTLPKLATGNRHSTQEINGVDLVNLALFWLVHPKAYLDEVRVYVHNRNPATLPYSQLQIVRAEHRLGLTRKAVSSTSDTAHLPLNMHICYLYQNAAFLDGVLGDSTQDIIDLDESKFKIEDQNCRFGKILREKQCNARGKYINGLDGIDLLMAISGDEQADQDFLSIGVTSREILICGSSRVSLMTFFAGWLPIDPGGNFCS